MLQVKKYDPLHRLLLVHEIVLYSLYLKEYCLQNLCTTDIFNKLYTHINSEEHSLLLHRLDFLQLSLDTSIYMRQQLNYLANCLKYCALKEEPNPKWELSNNGLLYIRQVIEAPISLTHPHLAYRRLSHLAHKVKRGQEVSYGSPYGPLYIAAT